MKEANGQSPTYDQDNVDMSGFKIGPRDFYEAGKAFPKEHPKTSALILSGATIFLDSNPVLANGLTKQISNPELDLRPYYKWIGSGVAVLWQFIDSSVSDKVHASKGSDGRHYGYKKGALYQELAWDAFLGFIIGDSVADISGGGMQFADSAREWAKAVLASYSLLDNKRRIGIHLTEAIIKSIRSRLKR